MNIDLTGKVALVSGSLRGMTAQPLRYGTTGLKGEILRATGSSTTSASPLDEQQRQLFVDVEAVSA